MIKKTIIFISFLIISSCSIVKPEFKTVEDVKIYNIENQIVTISANAVFTNPNSLGGKLFKSDIDVFINEKKLAKVDYKDFKIPAKKDFRIPLTVKVPLEELMIDKDKNILENIFKILKVSKDNKIKIKFKGKIKMKISEIPINYDLNVEKFLKLK